VPVTVTVTVAGAQGAASRGFRKLSQEDPRYQKEEVVVVAWEPQQGVAPLSHGNCSCPSGDLKEVSPSFPGFGGSLCERDFRGGPGLSLADPPLCLKAKWRFWVSRATRLERPATRPGKSVGSAVMLPWARDCLRMVTWHWESNAQGSCGRWRVLCSRAITRLRSNRGSSNMSNRKGVSSDRGEKAGEVAGGWLAISLSTGKTQQLRCKTRLYASLYSEVAC